MISEAWRSIVHRANSGLQFVGFWRARPYSVR